MKADSVPASITYSGIYLLFDRFAPLIRTSNDAVEKIEWRSLRDGPSGRSVARSCDPCDFAGLILFSLRVRARAQRRNRWIQPGFRRFPHKGSAITGITGAVRTTLIARGTGPKFVRKKEARVRVGKRSGTGGGLLNRFLRGIRAEPLRKQFRLVFSVSQAKISYEKSERSEDGDERRRVCLPARLRRDSAT